MYNHFYNSLKHMLDALSIGAAIGAVLGLLPKIAAGMSILWLGIQIRDRIKYGPHGERKHK